MTAILTEGELTRELTLAVGELVPSVTANAYQVRAHMARKIEEANGDVKQPLRNVDPKTGEVVIFSSMEDLAKWLPECKSEDLLSWSQLPIFRVALYTDKSSWVAKQTAYVYQVFPEGLDLAAALAWWRKRMSQAGRGFAVFEAGFDNTGPIFKTEPPYLCVDGVTGECIADAKEEIAEATAAHEAARHADEVAEEGHVRRDDGEDRAGRAVGAREEETRATVHAQGWMGDEAAHGPRGFAKVQQPAEEVRLQLTGGGMTGDYSGLASEGVGFTFSRLPPHCMCGSK